VATATSFVTDDETGWVNGDSIILLSTGNTNTGVAYSSEDYKTVDSVAGTTVNITAGLSYGHYASGNFKCDVVLLTRNVKMRRAGGASAFGFTNVYGSFNLLDLYATELQSGYPVFSSSNDFVDVSFELCSFNLNSNSTDFQMQQTSNIASTVTIKNTIICQMMGFHLEAYNYDIDGLVIADSANGSGNYSSFRIKKSSAPNSVKNLTIAGHNGSIYFYIEDQTTIDGIEVYTSAYSSPQVDGVFYLSGTSMVVVKDGLFWKNYYSVFLFTYSGTPSIVVFDNCYFCGNASQSSSKGDLSCGSTLSYPYNGLVIIKGNCIFDGWSGIGTYWAIYGGFCNMIIEAGVQFCPSTPYSGQYYSFGVGSEVHIINPITSNFYPGNTTNLGILDYVAFHGVNDNKNVVKYYSNAGSLIEKDRTVYYGNSGHSLKITPYPIDEAKYFALVRFWIPCTENEQVSVSFRARKNYIGWTEHPTATLRGLGMFTDQVATMSDEDTGWHLKTLAGTPTMDGSLILDFFVKDSGGRSLNLDDFSVVYG
jgi:hypothetical protein